MKSPPGVAPAQRLAGSGGGWLGRGKGMEETGSEGDFLASLWAPGRHVLLPTSSSS